MSIQKIFRNFGFPGHESGRFLKNTSKLVFKISIFGSWGKPISGKLIHAAWTMRISWVQFLYNIQFLYIIGTRDKLISGNVVQLWSVSRVVTHDPKIVKYFWSTKSSFLDKLFRNRSPKIQKSVYLMPRNFAYKSVHWKISFAMIYKTRTLKSKTFSLSIIEKTIISVKIYFYFSDQNNFFKQTFNVSWNTRG